MMNAHNCRWYFVLALASLVPMGATLEAVRAQESAPKAEKSAPRAPSLPATPAERDSILSDLYAKLAAAKDDSESKSVEDRIERVWLHSGSPTVDLLFGRAMRAVAEKDFDQALLFLNHVVEQAPDFAEGWSRRAYVHFQRNDVVLALGDLRRALALDPSNFKVLDGLGQVLRDVDEKPAALAVMRRLFKVHPRWPGVEKAVQELAREVEGQPI